MERRIERIPVQLPNDSVILVEAIAIGSDHDVGTLERLPIEQILGAIEGIAVALGSTLQKVNPSKANVELGLEIGVETGKLVAILAKASGKANLKINLEWTAQK
ncbi:MAG: hypothetical protein HY040_17675 [Planctomycetes bacterium]|nr:hypothetical protein [Planctomycetota bacterium]